MILDDANRFAFVHVPKCAGTSVRRQLAPFDTTGGAYSGGLVTLPGVGEVDTAHIPLAVLRDHFPDAFDKVVAYDAFAVLRDPFDRFPTSLFQRLQMYGQTEIAALSTADIRARAQEVMDLLCARGPQALQAYDLIHFQPQATYVELDGQRVVEHIHDIRALARFWTDADARLGGVLQDAEELQNRKTNESRVYRSASTERLVSAIPPGLRYRLIGLIPKGLKTALRGAAFEPGKKRLNDVMQDPQVDAFVRDFYARDIALYAEAQARAAQHATPSTQPEVTP